MKNSNATVLPVGAEQRPCRPDVAQFRTSPPRKAVGMPTPLDASTEQAHRSVTELDEAIIELVRRRTAAHAEMVALRRAAGGPVTELARENEVLRRYGEVFGAKGTTLALLLMDLGRRTRPPAPRIPAQQRNEADFARN
ncbi:chorismate mutase [Streptomyces virginiae]|uniref:chorismate mutase n=1 Tax=Streptomyces virginiae TaxID=1961 RepID=UPI00343388B9